jgi:hypothetical protein
VISPAELFERATLVTCSIINVSSYVNCREGPGTANKIIATARNGDKYKFSALPRASVLMAIGETPFPFLAFRFGVAGLLLAARNLGLTY